MANFNYWERRQAEDMVKYMQIAEETADQISNLYLRASKYISFLADGIFEKYQTKHNLTEQEAVRLLNELQDKTSLDELIHQLKNTDSRPEREELKKKLEAPAYQARIERLGQLQNQLDNVMRDIYHQEKDLHTAHYLNLANASFYKSIFNLQQQTGLGFSFSHVDDKIIERVVNSRWSGKNYSERIWKNTRVLAKDIKEELLINLVTGRTNREVAEILNNKYASGASAARRLVRTESNYLATEMNFKAYEEAGVEKYCYLAILDLQTSELCRNLDRKIFPVSERKAGVNCPPMHPWCRSTTISVINEELLNKLQRSAINPETGKVIKIPMNMSYHDWYNKYVKGNARAELEEKKIQNRLADRKQWKKYQDILGEDIPDSLDKFQKIKYNEVDKWKKIEVKKQEALGRMDYSDMEKLKGKLTDRETRIWYKAHDEKIPSLIDKTLTIEQQAKKACELRNQNRTFARDLMQNQTKRKELDISDPNKSFEQLIQHKMDDKGLSYDDAVADILKTSTKTRKSVNKMLGLE